MTTINKLRNQVDELKLEAAKEQVQDAKTKNVLIILLIVALGIIVYLLARKKTSVAP